MMRRMRYLAQLAFVHRDTAETERQNAVNPGLGASGVRLPGYSGNGTPERAGGVTIPEGSLVTLALGSANRDPRKWGPTADILDVARPGANEHVSFGGGSHFCPGNALARLEAQVALPKLVRRFPRMEPASTEPAWTRRITLRGVETLPVVLR
jgi:cytochrome P450